MIDDLKVDETELSKKIEEALTLEEKLKQVNGEIEDMIKIYLGTDTKATIKENITIERKAPKKTLKVVSSVIQKKMFENEHFKRHCLENLDISINKPKTAQKSLELIAPIIGLDNEFLEKCFTTSVSKEKFSYKK